MKFTYDGWGNTELSRQDHNSAVDASGSVDDYDVEWAFTKATGGRNTLRRTTMNYPDETQVEYTYLSTPHDADASRVTRVKYETVVVAEYSYLGLAQLAGQDLSQADARWHTYDTTVSGVTLYGDLDRFNRVIQSRWTGYRVSGTRDFYHVELDYDRNSNIVAAEDHVHTAGAAGTGNGLFDAMYSIDAVNRLTQTKEGNWTGSAIDNPKRDEIWTLTQTGNWDLRKLDLDGDLNYNEAGELQDRGVFNLANELKTRNTNDSGGVEFTLTHDKAGNLTDDGDDYKYEYDAFGRLRKVKNQSNVLVAEYTYNGLGQRIGWHYDVDADGTVESSADDPWYRFVYDDAWRVIATYRGSDTSPKEHFVYHAAGLGAFGGSSYIDATIIRERDITNGWSGAADGTLEQRHAYCHNWRGDVTAVLTSVGKMVEWVKYSSYGVPFGLPSGDTDSDGDWDATDSGFISDSTKPYDVRRDADLDGDADSADVTHANSIVSGYQTLGRGVLTSTAIGNRKGYAGYERDPTFHGAGRHLHHVRHRVYDADVGRWTRRDPQGYVDGMSLYAYVQGMAVIAVDPWGLWICMGCGPGDHTGGGGGPPHGGGGGGHVTPGRIGTPGRGTGTPSGREYIRRAPVRRGDGARGRSLPGQLMPTRSVTPVYDLNKRPFSYDWPRPDYLNPNPALWRDLPAPCPAMPYPAPDPADSNEDEEQDPSPDPGEDHPENEPHLADARRFCDEKCNWEAWDAILRDAVVRYLAEMKNCDFEIDIIEVEKCRREAKDRYAEKERAANKYYFDCFHDCMDDYFPPIPP